MFKDDELVIYEVSQSCDGEVNRWYEVFKHVVRPIDKFHDDEYEYYPNDESFGSWAWCCSNEACLKKVLKMHFPNHKLTYDL